MKTCKTCLNQIYLDDDGKYHHNAFVTDRHEAMLILDNT